MSSQRADAFGVVVSIRRLSRPVAGTDNVSCRPCVSSTQAREARTRLPGRDILLCRKGTHYAQIVISRVVFDTLVSDLENLHAFSNRGKNGGISDTKEEKGYPWIEHTAAKHSVRSSGVVRENPAPPANGRCPFSAPRP